MTGDDPPNPKQEEENVGTLRSLTERKSFRENAVYGNTVHEQLERLRDIDPNLIEVLRIRELHYVKLAIFCAIVKLIEELPEQLDEQTTQNAQNTSYEEEIALCDQLDSLDVDFKLARIKKQEHTVLVAEKIGQLLYLIRTASEEATCRK